MVTGGRYVAAGQVAYLDSKSETEEALASGTYFYQPKAGGHTETRRLGMLS